jgi:hypothetical protein
MDRVTHSLVNIEPGEAAGSHELLPREVKDAAAASESSSDYVESPLQSIIKDESKYVPPLGIERYGTSSTRESLGVNHGIAAALHAQVGNLNTLRRQGGQVAIEVKTTALGLLKNALEQISILENDHIKQDAEYLNYLKMSAHELSMLINHFDYEQGHWSKMWFLEGSSAEREQLVEQLRFLMDDDERSVSVSDIYKRLKVYLRSVGFSGRELGEFKFQALKDAVNKKVVVYGSLGTATAGVFGGAYVVYASRIAELTPFNPILTHTIATFLTLAVSLPGFQRAWVELSKNRAQSLITSLKHFVPRVRKAIEQKFLPDVPSPQISKVISK